MSDPGPDGVDADSPFVGQGVARREDFDLLTGNAEYTDDIAPPDAAHLAFARSEAAHARVTDVDTAAAEAVEGVVAVYTWADVEASDAPGVLPISTDPLDVDVPGHPVLSKGRVRYHGQPIAAVVAENRYAAHDGADAVEVEYDDLGAVTDPTEARGEDAPTLYESAPDNVAATTGMGDREATEAAFDDADRVVSVDLRNNRLIPNALEPRAALADPDGPDGKLSVTMTSQSPHGHRGKLSATLGIPERKLRVVAPDVGGGFGHKGHHHPGEAAAAWAALQLDRPVRWTATRSGNAMAGAHGRDHRTHAELALDDDGTIRGLRADTDAAVGGYGLGGGAVMPGWYGRLLAGQYEIPAIFCETRAVFTTTAPVHSYRGAGRPEAVYVVERLVDAAARELDVDPVELRRRNQIPADDFPHETAVGAEYDSGDYEATMDAALEAVGYDDLRARAGTERDDGTYLGVGVANYVESTGGGFESGVVRVHPDGGVTVFAGTHSHGQGHGTTYAQIVADELGIPMSEIEVHEGDTDRVPQGTGTFGSRSTIVGGNAVRESAIAVREKARELAANRLDVDPEALTLDGGSFVVADESERFRADGGAGGGDAGGAGGPTAVTFAEIARDAHGRNRPEGVSPGLDATTFYEPDGTAYSFGTHVAVVAVDPATGEVDVERYLAADDCGPQVNPEIVEGQVHGAVAQGLGQARYEEAVYDDQGRLVTDGFREYAFPGAGQLPDVETLSTETPSPNNPLGVKGVGEGGTIAAPPALVNAVLSALAPLGVDSVDMPLTEENVWTAIHEG